MTSGTLTLSECTAFGFKAEVKMNGCEYEYLEPTKRVAGTKVLCPAGKQIEIVAIGFCTMTIGAQTPSGSATFDNNGGSPSTTTVTSSITGITYGGNCGSGTNGAHTGAMQTKGYSDSAHKNEVGLTVAD